MENIEIRTKLLLSMQRALIGMIYQSIRAIKVEFFNLDLLKVTVYLDRMPIGFDYENLSDITGEILADIEFKKTEEMCLYSKDSKLDIKNESIWVYMRKEE